MYERIIEQMKLPEMWEGVFYAMLNYSITFLIVFGGTLPYIPQYLEIRSTKNADGFSTYVCLTLLIANILRILFWFGHPFELPLLVQSIMMILSMLAMIHICVTVQHKSEIVNGKPHVFTDFDSRYFWKWTDVRSYIECVLVFSLIASFVTFLLLDVPVYVETLGTLALLVEAMLAVPQFYKNAQNQSTKGMSLKMVLCWTAGDVLKTAYFFVRKAPLQFSMCGSLQICVDIAILAQVVLYSKSKK